MWRPVYEWLLGRRTTVLEELHENEEYRVVQLRVQDDGSLCLQINAHTVL